MRPPSTSSSSDDYHSVASHAVASVDQRRPADNNNNLVTIKSEGEDASEAVSLQRPPPVSSASTPRAAKRKRVLPPAEDHVVTPHKLRSAAATSPATSSAASARTPQAPPPPRVLPPSGSASVVTYHPYDVRSKINLYMQKTVIRTFKEEGSDVVPIRLDKNMREDFQRDRSAADPLNNPDYKGYPFFKEEDDATPPPPPGTPLEFDRHSLLKPQLTEEELEQHPYMDHPPMHQKCEFCGASHCAVRFRDREGIACRRMRYHCERTPTREICRYLRCHNKTTHMVKACPALHQRCPRCAVRGHGREDLCDVNNPLVMEAFRADFELAAGQGAFTRRVTVNGEPQWGWYPLAPQATQVSYSHLSRMRAVDALRLVQDLGALVPADLR